MPLMKWVKFADNETCCIHNISDNRVNCSYILRCYKNAFIYGAWYNMMLIILSNSIIFNRKINYADINING